MTELDRSALHLIHRVSQVAAELFAANAGPTGLTPRQFAVLVSVSGNEGLSQTDLVELTGIDRSTLADLVGRLIKRGLLHRRRTQRDARVYAIRLTELGNSMLEKAIPAAAKAEEQLLSALDEVGQEKLIETLQQLDRRKMAA